MNTNTPYLSGFTALRGLGSLLVAFGHYQIFVGLHFERNPHWVRHPYYLIVDGFFIMSGFILFHVYGRQFSGSIRGDDYKRFLAARFARIYPMHVFTLLLFVGMYVMHGGPFYIPGSPDNTVANPRAILINIGLLQSFNIYPNYTWNIPSWSVSAEWWAYLTLPFTAWLLGAGKRKALVALLLAVLTGYLAIMYLLPRTDLFRPGMAAPHNLDSTYDYGYLRGLAGFWGGNLLYLLYEYPRARKLFARDWVCCCMLMALFISVQSDCNDIACLALMGLFILSIGCNGGRMARTASLPALQFLGEISYSVYMMHLLILLLFFKFLRVRGLAGDQPVLYPGWIKILLGLAYIWLVALASIGSYYLVEKPLRQWISARLSKQSRRGQPDLAV